MDIFAQIIIEKYYISSIIDTGSGKYHTQRSSVVQYHQQLPQLTTYLPHQPAYKDSVRGDSAAYGAPAPAFSDHEGLHQATTSRVWPPTSFREARPHFILFIGFVEPYLPALDGRTPGAPRYGSPPDIPMTAPDPRGAGNGCRNVQRFANRSMSARETCRGRKPIPGTGRARRHPHRGGERLEQDFNGAALSQAFPRLAPLDAQTPSTTRWRIAWRGCNS